MNERGQRAFDGPEQAKGKKVERRSDIWAFGVVLYEILTGTRAFDGETASEILAAVIMADPDFRKGFLRIHHRGPTC